MQRYLQGADGYVVTDRECILHLHAKLCNKFFCLD